MTINVKFAKNGWWSPAYGRMGRGHNTNRVYQLPDYMRDHLPSSAQISSDDAELDKWLEDEEQAKPIKPVITDADQLERMKKQKPVKPVAASERKTPQRRTYSQKTED